MALPERAAPPQAKNPVLFFSLDREDRLVQVSKEWLDRLGYGRAEVLGRPVTEFLTDTSRRYALDTVFPNYHSSGFCTEIPLQFQAKGGAPVDVLFSASAASDESGAIFGTRAVMTVVTPLQASRELLFRAFRASGAILIISTVASGRFIEVNEAFERVIGYQHDEVTGKESSQLKIWENPADRDRYLRLLEREGRVRDLEVRFRSKSGKALAGLLSGELVDLAGEKCLLTIINDVTDRKRAAEEMEVLHTELASHALALEIANEELEAFSYTVSHDLRKPLTAISGYCQILLNVVECPGSDCRSLLNEILDGTVRMTQLIETLLEFSHLGQGELQKSTVDVSALASGAVRELRAAAPDRKVRISVEEGLTAQGDAGLLRVVLDNLMGNAWKYTAQNDEACIRFGCRKIEGDTVYFVEDNGVGFAPSTSDKLFKPFHRHAGAQQFAGFGIGLATVKRIINRHGGRVWADGEPEKGAAFYFTLPC